jgi:hypothetical protein
LILAFIPAEINGDTLNTMTAFAIRVVDIRHRPWVLICDIDRRLAFGRIFTSNPTFVYG